MLFARTAKGRGLQASTEVPNGGFCAYGKNTRKARAICYIAHQEEEEEEEEKVVFSSNYGRLVTVVDLLKTLITPKDLHRGFKIHADVVRNGLLEKDLYVSSALISMYARCGDFAFAQQVFDGLLSRNVVSWNALIAGYAQHGHPKNALVLYEWMQDAGFSPNDVTFVCILKACGSMRASHNGTKIHTQIDREGMLGSNLVVANALIDMYCKCGLLVKAQEVLDKLPVQDVFSWTALITGYTQHGQGEDAFNCFERMQCRGISPNIVTFICTLKACGTIMRADKGELLHAEIVKKGLLGNNTKLANSLVDMYVKCSLFEEAQEVFDKLPARDVVSWNVLIAGLAQSGQGEAALKHFECMRLRGHSPDAVTTTCILKACGSIGAAEMGQNVHAEAVRDGLLEKDVVVVTALVDMYANCGILAKAQEVFDKTALRNVIMWTALLAGYAHHGYVEEAMSCFGQMQREGFSPDAVTFVCILQACGNNKAADRGQEIHAQIVREGVLEEDVVIGTALVDMYANCSMFTEAQEVFDSLTIRDIVSWNALITRFVQHMRAEEALTCLKRMQLEGSFPDPVTYVGILKACGSTGAANEGQEIHTEIVRRGLMERDSVLAAALLDMYANCGMLEEAENVFDKLQVQDVILWTMLLAGYAQLGNDQIVFELFDRMIGEGVKPNGLTCTVLLNACSHTGLLDKGRMFFETMITGYGIVPTSEHHNCIVDLLSRAGHLDTALAIINEMPIFADLTVWHTLLGVCQSQGESEVGKVAFDHATQLNKKDAASYVCMGNVFVAAGRPQHTKGLET